MKRSTICASWSLQVS